MDGYGERIKELRQILGLSQSELAELLGVHKQMVSDVERGKQKRFSMESEAMLIRKLNVDPIWLLTGEGDPIRKQTEAIEEEMAIVRKYFNQLPPQRRLKALIAILQALEEQGDNI